MANLYFISRRAYNSSKKKFSDNLAELTRFVELTQVSDTVSSGAIIDRDLWVQRVKAVANGGPVLCFVHGFNTTQSFMLKRMQKIQAGLAAKGFNGAVVAYDWPSKGRVLEYLTDRRQAKAVARYFVAEGLGPLMNAFPPNRLHLLTHSMGALVLIRSFSQTGDAGTQPWAVGEILMVAADVDAVDLTKGTGHALVLDRRSKRATNYFSNQDKVLKLSENIVSGGRDRLGFDGMPSPQAPGLFDVACGTRYHQSIPKPPGSDTEQRFSHTWYFEDPQFFKDAAKTLAGTAADQMGATRAPLAGDPTDQALVP